MAIAQKGEQADGAGMSILDLFKKRAPDRLNKPQGISTVKFDATRVTSEVKADLHDAIAYLPDVGPGISTLVYKAALRSITAGRATHILYETLMDAGMTRQRAYEISIYLNNRATSLMNNNRALASGLTKARWLHSGSPCASNDAAHRAANRKEYDIRRGLLIDGKWSAPGREAGCKCVANPIVPGFD